MPAFEVRAVEDDRRSHIQDLVEVWSRSDPTLQQVILFEPLEPSERHRPILLLQVKEATPDSPDRVEAYGFAPTRETPFPLALAQVTPAEWRRIQAGQLDLPEGWSLERGEIVF